MNAKYEYKFVEVSLAREWGGNFLKIFRGNAFETCKEVMQKEAASGWRFKQIVVPIDEKRGVFCPCCYQVIFEKEVESVHSC